MKTLAILPIKSFQSAKQRLGREYGTGSRSALARAMYSDVLAALRRCKEIDSIVVVTGAREAVELAHAQGISVQGEAEEKGQSKALVPEIDRAVSQGFERVILVPGDCPLASPAEIDDVLRRAAAAGTAVTIVPDRHDEGTNALILHPPKALDPQFGPQSQSRHIEQAKQRGLSYEVESLESLALDIDTAEDLNALAERLESWHGGAPSTRGVIQQLQRMHRTTAPAA